MSKMGNVLTLPDRSFDARWLLAMNVVSVLRSADATIVDLQRVLMVFTVPIDVFNSAAS